MLRLNTRSPESRSLEVEPPCYVPYFLIQVRGSHGSPSALLESVLKKVTQVGLVSHSNLLCLSRRNIQDSNSTEYLCTFYFTSQHLVFSPLSRESSYKRFYTAGEAVQYSRSCCPASPSDCYVSMKGIESYRFLLKQVRNVFIDTTSLGSRFSEF